MTTGPATTLELLATAVRVALGSNERISWPEHLDGAAVVAAADRHGVLVLFDRAMTSIEASDPSSSKLRSALQSALRPLMRQRTERALLLMRQLRSLIQFLQDAGIEVLPVKGPVLAATAYADVASRGASGDLDLIVHPADLDRAIATLEGHGYRRAEPSAREHAPDEWAREAHLFPRSATEGTLVELHTELRGNAQTPPLDLDAVMARSQPRSLFGMSVRTMDVEDQILYLSLHAAQHAWSRMIWTADVAALLRQPAIIDWPKLFDTADAIDARHRLTVTLRLAAELLGASVPDDVHFGRRVRRTARMAVRRMRTTASVAAGAPSRLTWFRSELAVRETAAQRLAFLALQIAPNGRDRSWIELPRAVRWLSWIIRPLRLLVRVVRGTRLGHEPAPPDEKSR